MNGSTAAYHYVVGLDPTERVGEEDLARFDAFYSEVHQPEVIAANPGFIGGRRYRLSGQDPRWNAGPRLLAVYDLEDEAAATTYLQTQRTPGTGIDYTPSPVPWTDFNVRWRLILRTLRQFGEPTPEAPELFLAGLDAEAGASDDAFAELVTFHAEVHVPEVMALAGYRTAQTYLVEASLTDTTPMPRLLVTYRAAPEQQTTARELMVRLSANGDGNLFDPGPPAWQRRQSLWRLHYATHRSRSVRRSI